MIWLEYSLITGHPARSRRIQHSVSETAGTVLLSQVGEMA